MRCPADGILPDTTLPTGRPWEPANFIFFLAGNAARLSESELRLGRFPGLVVRGDAPPVFLETFAEGNVRSTCLQVGSLFSKLAVLPITIVCSNRFMYVPHGVTLLGRIGRGTLSSQAVQGTSHE